MAVTEPPKAEPAPAPHKAVATPTKLVLRDISKGIFFYPLAIYSFIAALVEHFMEQAESGGALPSSAANVLSLIWVVLFFANVFVVSFDFSTGKFLILILIIALVGLLVFLAMENEWIPASTGLSIDFNLQIRTQFYVMVSVILILVVLLTLLVAQFRYVKIEANEVIVRGILGDVKRFPTTNLHYEKKISDVFEYLTLRAGTITMHISGASEPVELYTVVNVHKKAEQMDALLSAMKVSH